ncbi:uncharacterized mitochondrial protein AtMg00810-like [Mangifera indica]|uniref:uncharacterized mitochondrial protein AtMg00810-like n=1 Tax=Mangifera indica TaxID=29780 RepID=UPI001CFACD05|nr:uncharacterized mitochondrial protein AtMg00810-like [Mangifera indica]
MNILILYADNIIITGDDHKRIEDLKKLLDKEFEIKDLGNFRYFLGMEVVRSKAGIFISQRKCQRREVEVFTYADWAGSITDRCSTIGYYIYVWRNMVTWHNKKQSVVARSSIKAEYRAMAHGICEGIWIQLLEELRVERRGLVKLYNEDIQSCHQHC